MTSVKDGDLLKLLQSAVEACTKAEGGDVAEQGRALDALRLLGKQAVTADVLAKTEAGKKVKKLGKSPIEAIQRAANDVVEAWKDCVRMEQKKKNESGSAAPTTSAATKSENTALESQPSNSGRQSTALGTQDSLNEGLSSGKTPSASGAAAAVNRPKKCGDPTRDKIRELLTDALALAVGQTTGPDDYPGDPADVAVEVEEAMFKQSGEVNAKYKAKYRTLGFNLKDPNNPDLRGRVLTGEIPAEILVNLSAEELGSNDRRQGNEKIREHMKRECERGQQAKASTDAFQCGRCKQRKCTYYQMQTRSADEPMTTFVQCVNCGNRWKFC